MCAMSATAIWATRKGKKGMTFGELVDRSGGEKKRLVKVRGRHEWGWIFVFTQRGRDPCVWEREEAVERKKNKKWKDLYIFYQRLQNIVPRKNSVELESNHSPFLSLIFFFKESIIPTTKTRRKIVLYYPFYILENGIFRITQQKISTCHTSFFEQAHVCILWKCVHGWFT